MKSQKAVIKVKNGDDNWLQWALRSAQFTIAKDSKRPSKYPRDDGLDFDARISVSQVAKVENQNNLAISLFS